MLQHSCDTKVANLDLARLGHEDVLSLEISVKDLPVVDVFDCEGHLYEPIENLILTVAHLADLLLICNTCV